MSDEVATPIPDVSELLARSGWVRRLAYRLAADDEEDLRHEAWLATRGEHQTDPRSIRAWLGTVLRNLLSKRRLSDSRRGDREKAYGALPRDVESPEALVARAQTERLVAELVLALPEPYRQAILLRYFDELSAAEIARRLRIPPGTVRWRVKMGVERLRQALDERSGGRQRWLLDVIPGTPRRAGRRFIPLAAAAVVVLGPVTWLSAPRKARLLRGISALFLSGIRAAQCACFRGHVAL